MSSDWEFEWRRLLDKETHIESLSDVAYLTDEFWLGVNVT